MDVATTQTPAALGYAFPPEWDRHAGTWFSWARPSSRSFPGKYETIPENLARIVAAVQERERVHVNVQDEAQVGLVSSGCGQFGIGSDRHVVLVERHGDLVDVVQSDLTHPQPAVRV